MRVHASSLGAIVVAVLATGCVPPPTPVGVSLARTDGRAVFAVLPAESVEFPLAARATNERMRRARVKGLDMPTAASVSLEVVLLSIECVEPSDTCIAAAGKELAANQMLFARIEAGSEKEQVVVTVTLFDVDRQQRRRAAAKVFSSEDDVPFGIAAVVDEATRP